MPEGTTRSEKNSVSVPCVCFCRRSPTSPEPVPSSGSFFSPSSSHTTDDIRDGNLTHVSKATFKPSSSNGVLSYATMPRGNEKRDIDIKRWKGIEENNNDDAFISRRG